MKILIDDLLCYLLTQDLLLVTLRVLDTSFERKKAERKERKKKREKNQKMNKGKSEKKEEGKKRKKEKNSEKG